MGVIVAPPGSGKTIIALKLIADRQQPALIVVHRKQLMDQWLERISTFLGIAKTEVGIIGQGKRKVGKYVTIATIQSLSKTLGKSGGEKIEKSFGTVIVDECHHVPASTFRNTIQRIHSYYTYGLTATPFRKYNDGKLIFIYLGEVIAEVKPLDIGAKSQPKIIIRNTEFEIPYNPKIDKFEIISQVLIHDSARNRLVLEDVEKELATRNRVVIITERKEHIETLWQYLKQAHEVVTLSGEDTETSRIAKWKMLNEGSYQVLITTGQFFGEGTDLSNASCLFLVYPFSFEGKLIQYMGRVQRSEIRPVIYDYRDIRIDYLNKLFLKRNTYYRKLEKQATLFDDPIEETQEKEKVVTIDKTIPILIDSLEFHFGSIAFEYIDPELSLKLEFEIMNYDIRPEFEVLKPYFEKALKSKYISVCIFAEIEDGKLISQSASSPDIDKINRELVEGLRFRFISKQFVSGQPDKKETLPDVNQLQQGNNL